VAAAVPEIEVADHADAPRIRRQHGEAHALDAVERETGPVGLLLLMQATSPIRAPGDIDAALAHAAAQQVQALFVADDSYIAGDPAARRRVLAFASAARMPVVSSHLPYARDGALLAMGPSIPVLAARAAGYVDRILKGARIADLPVELPSVLVTVVNRRAARALALKLPPTLIARADEVIE